MCVWRRDGLGGDLSANPAAFKGAETVQKRYLCASTRRPNRGGNPAQAAPYNHKLMILGLHHRPLQVAVVPYIDLTPV